MSNKLSNKLLALSGGITVIVASLLLGWLIIPLIDILSDKIVGPFTELLPYENSFIVILVSLCVCLSCLALIVSFIRITNHHIFSWRTSICSLGVGISIVLVWGFYRFVSNNWYFLPLFGTRVAIVDVLVLTFAIVLVTIVILNYRGGIKNTKAYSENNSNNQQADSMQSDRPIDYEEEDKLRRTPFAEKLISKIENLDTSKGARSLAVTAPWGNGKTSFLNLVKNGLKKNEYSVVDIIPWNLNPNKSITAYFFEEIVKKFGGIDNQISRYLKEYSNMLESVNLSFLSSIFSNISLPDMAKKISDAMILKGIKVVIVFDDIDRLDASEIEEVFRIIRGSANFKNFIFISAFDKRYVQEALQNSNAAFNEHYIEKFFEMEFPLPEIRTDLIESIILENIQWMSAKDQKDFKEYITRNVSWLGDTSPYAPLTNLRIIYRWLNSLKYRYEILRDECVIRDLADLELLNLIFPQVYSLLASDYETFFECESHQNTYKLWNDSMKVSRDSNWIKYINQKNKKDLLKYCEEELKMTKSQIQELGTILERLLPNHRYHGEAKAFSNPNYTQRYFDSILSQSDIKQSVFNDMIAGKDSYVEFITNDKEQVFSHSLFLLCHESKPDTKDELKMLFNIIFYASSYYSRFGFSYYTIRDKMYKFKLPKEEKKEIFLGLILENGFSNWLYMSFIPGTHSERQGWQDIFSEDECNQILSSLFDKAINEGASLNELSSLYHYAQEKVGKTDDESSYICKNEQIKNKYKAILAQSSFKDPSWLIYTQPPDGLKYYPSTDFVQLWGNWTSLSSYIEEQQQHDKLPQSSSKAWEEFETFIKEWEENNKEPISFTFNHINMSKG